MDRTRARHLPLLLALLLPAGCDSISDALHVDPGDLAQLTVSPVSVPADTASRITVTARVPATGDRKVKLTTTAGTLIGANAMGVLELTADINGVATAELRAPAASGTALVRLENGTFVRTTSVEFVRVFPEVIVVDPGEDILEVSLGDTTVVTAHLRRGLGVASSGTAVEFSAITPSGSEVGIFSSQTLSDDDGDATALFGMGSSSFRGVVIIRARVVDPATGRVVEGRANIQVTS